MISLLQKKIIFSLVGLMSLMPALQAASPAQAILSKSMRQLMGSAVGRRLGGRLGPVSSGATRAITTQSRSFNDALLDKEHLWRESYPRASEVMMRLMRAACEVAGMDHHQISVRMLPPEVDETLRQRFPAYSWGAYANSLDRLIVINPGVYKDPEMPYGELRSLRMFLHELSHIRHLDGSVCAYRPHALCEREADRDSLRNIECLACASVSVHSFREEPGMYLSARDARGDVRQRQFFEENLCAYHKDMPPDLIRAAIQSDEYGPSARALVDSLYRPFISHTVAGMPSTYRTS